jgi:hypothetical protein
MHIVGLDTKGPHILTSWEIQILAFIVTTTKSHKDNKLPTLQSIELLLVNTYNSMTCDPLLA